MSGSDLPTLLREFADGGTGPISVEEIRARAAARPVAAPARYPVRIGLTATGLAAAGIAAGLVASQAGGGAGVTRPGAHSAGSGRSSSERVVLDAATLRHIASASRTAMATSGQAVISYQTTGDPDFDQTGTENIAFDGGNWRNSVSYAPPGATPEHAIDEVVDGQAYDFFPVYSRTPQWVHDTGPDAVAALNIPDPRTLLAVLSPGAGFVADGYTTIDGTRVEHLRASTPGNVPAAALGALVAGTPASTVTALDVWADDSGVVRQITFTLTGTSQGVTLNSAAIRQFVATERRTAPGGRVKISLSQLEHALAGKATVHDYTATTAVSVEFRQIGQPQPISAPTAYITVAGKG